MTLRPFVFFLVLAVLALRVPSAWAYGVSDCHGDLMRWNHSPITMRTNSTDFPDGPWRLAIDSAIDRVNQNPSSFRFTSATDGGGSDFDNGESEVWGTLNPSIMDWAPAATFHERLCAPIIIPFPPFFLGWLSRIEEEDIVVDFSGGTDWRAGSLSVVTELSNFGGDGRLLNATAIHELGHAAGLGHENAEYNVMGADFEHLHINNWIARGYLGEDAADGLVHLYGSPQSSHPFEDIGVAPWVYSWADGEYSRHRRVYLYDTTDTLLRSQRYDYDGDGDTDEIRFRVNPGQRVRVEFTYENNGATRQNPVAVGFYLSDEAFVTTADTRIGGASLDLGRNDVYTARHNVTLPSNLVSGDLYWIGAIVDEHDDLAEDVEWNNATYVPVVVD